MTSEFISSQASKIAFSTDEFAQALAEHDYTFQKGQVIRGKVFQYTSDGAYVDIGGKSSGFVPLQEAALDNVIDLAQILPLQEEQDFLIIGEQNAEGQITLSRRQLLVSQAWEAAEEMAESGKTVQMRVTGSNRGGVIGEIDGLRGFIPRSHLLEKEDLDGLVGQLLTVNFLEVDPENKKLVLSQRRAMLSVEIGKVVPGTLVAGKVTRIQPYGVFVDLEGVTGLLHITQISATRIDSLDHVFTVGQTIKVMVVEVDDYKNRISLSTRVLENYPGEMVENQEELMQTAEDRVEKAKEKLVNVDS